MNIKASTQKEIQIARLCNNDYIEKTRYLQHSSKTLKETIFYYPILKLQVFPSYSAFPLSFDTKQSTFDEY